MVSLLNVGARPEPNPALIALVQWIEAQELERRRGYDLYATYYRGDEEVKVTDRVRKFLPADLEFTDNFCEIVVDVLVERLKVLGFQAGGNDALAEAAQAIWAANRMDLTQIIVHTEAAMKGDGYILVDWDDERGIPRLSFQAPEMVIPRYDPETGRIAWASKKWSWQPEIGGQTMVRLNLYYPDRVEKYRASGGLWLPFSDPEDGDQWPVPWMGIDGQPLGVNLFHFRNRPAGADYGMSELRGVIPLQDLLNKTLVDLTQVLDVMAWKQRYIVGAEVPSDGWTIVPGAVWNIASEAPESVQVGEFEATDVAGILQTIETLVQHIAGRSRTPQYLFQLAGQVPSGEALKTAESGLVNKAKLRAVGYGNAWEDAVLFAVKLRNTFGQPGERVTLNPGDRLETLWEDPETRNEVSHLEALGLKANLGVPRRQLWREMGYQEDQIAQMEQDEADQQAQESNIGAEILKRFSAGRLGGGQPTPGEPTE